MCSVLYNYNRCYDIKKQAEAKVVPSSSLVEVEVGVEVGVGVEVEVGVGVKIHFSFPNFDFVEFSRI